MNGRSTWAWRVQSQCAEEGGDQQRLVNDDDLGGSVLSQAGMRWRPSLVGPLRPHQDQHAGCIPISTTLSHPSTLSHSRSMRLQ